MIVRAGSCKTALTDRAALCFTASDIPRTTDSLYGFKVSKVLVFSDDPRSVFAANELRSKSHLWVGGTYTALWSAFDRTVVTGGGVCVFFLGIIEGNLTPTEI